MNKENLKIKIDRLQGKKYKFIFNGSRNQREKFNGIIIKTFPSIFLVKTTDKKSKIKSFSYNDVITSNLQIIEK